MADDGIAQRILYGGEEVPVLKRPWRSAPGVEGYRKTYSLKPGQAWATAPMSLNQIEHLALVDGQGLPVGVAIAAELMQEGADWAYCTEIWPSLVLLDHDAMCVALDGPAAGAVERLQEANGGALAGLPDVIAARGSTVILREAKRRGRDRLQPQQHAFASAARDVYGPNLDLAVVVWDH